MNILKKTLIELACFYLPLLRAWLSALLTTWVHSFLIKVFALDEYNRCHIIPIIEYVLF